MLNKNIHASLEVKEVIADESKVAELDEARKEVQKIRGQVEHISTLDEDTWS